MLTHSWGNKVVHTFPKGISSEENIIAQLEFELAYFKATNQHFNLNSMENPPTNYHVCLENLSFLNLFCLFVLMFNGIPTLLGYLMPNPSF